MNKTKSASAFWQQLILWSVGSFSLIILLLVLGIWRTSDRALNFITSLFNPQPIQPQIANSTLIVERIQNLQELATTVQKMETIVPTSAERKLGDISIATTRLLYIARGEVKAGVDLGEITANDITVNHNHLEIDLPPAKILDSKIDVNYSQVYDYDRGFLNLGPDVAPQLQTLAQKKTLTEIVNTACREGILTTANLRAKETITQLLTNTGYQQIKVNTTLPTSCETITEQPTVETGSR
jgi:Protein of unknown function (DUF4230)